MTTIKELDDYLNTRTNWKFTKIIVGPKTMRFIRIESASKNVHFAAGERIYYRKIPVELRSTTEVIEVFGFPNTELSKILYETA